MTRKELLKLLHLGPGDLRSPSSPVVVGDVVALFDAVPISDEVQALAGEVAAYQDILDDVREALNAQPEEDVRDVVREWVTRASVDRPTPPVIGEIPAVYVAGSYLGDTQWETRRNVRRAKEFGLELAHLGAVPLIPHANTDGFEGVYGISHDWWYDATRELLSRCDAILVIRTCLATSRGTKEERDFAAQARMPIFYADDDFCLGGGAAHYAIRTWIDEYKNGAPATV